MFSYKNNYYLYIDNTTTINLNLIKIREKYSIIYRNLKNKESVVVLKRFRQKCREKSIKFYVANDLYLLHTLKADGLYISAFNRKFSYLDKTIDIIGSAHNFKEIYEKKKTRMP